MCTVRSEQDQLRRPILLIKSAQLRDSFACCKGHTGLLYNGCRSTLGQPPPESKHKLHEMFYSRVKWQLGEYLLKST